MTNDELIAIAKSLKLNKAPDPDGIPTLAIKTAIEASPDMFRMALQMCLDRGEFPERLKLLPGVKLVGFADDITLVVYGESIEEVELTASHAIGIVEDWMRSRHLALAHHKTVVVVVNNHKSEQQAVVITDGCTINSKRSLKQLGVMIDDKLKFGSHVEYACKRASMEIIALSKIISNSSAIVSSKRKLLAAVAVSILRYGAAAWSKALMVNRNVKRLESTHRLMCLRVVSAYRTVSKDAVCVLAGMMPIASVVAENEE